MPSGPVRLRGNSRESGRWHQHFRPTPRRQWPVATLFSPGASRAGCTRCGASTVSPQAQPQQAHRGAPSQDVRPEQRGAAPPSVHRGSRNGDAAAADNSGVSIGERDTRCETAAMPMGAGRRVWTRRAAVKPGPACGKSGQSGAQRGQVAPNGRPSDALRPEGRHARSATCRGRELRRCPGTWTDTRSSPTGA